MRKAFLTLALVALVALPVLAQRGGRGFMGGGGDVSAQLLANKGVQEELKLTDSQKKDVKAATDARQKAFEKAREDKDFEAFGKINEDFTKAMKKVKDKLTSTQSKRLMQLEVQVAAKNKSVRIFQNPDVQKALKLTDKQKKKLKSTLSDLEKDTKELMEDAKGDFKKMRQAFGKMREMGQEAYTTVTKTLTEEQQKTWKTLGGEKFEGKGVPFESPFGKFGKGKDKGGKRKKKNDKKDDF